MQLRCRDCDIEFHCYAAGRTACALAEADWEVISSKCPNRLTNSGEWVQEERGVCCGECKDAWGDRGRVVIDLSGILDGSGKEDVEA